MKLTEKLMVFKGQYGYQTLLKKGEEDKLYIQVGFRKGQEPSKEKTIIDIRNGFLDFYKTKDGLAKTKIVILDYTEVEPPEHEDTGTIPMTSTTTVDDLALPF